MRQPSLSQRHLAIALATAFVSLMVIACSSSRGDEPSTPATPGTLPPTGEVAAPGSIAPETALPGRETSKRGATKFTAAPELVGLTGWINSEPLTTGGLNAQRRVVLIDVWTYTCVNCIRTFPYLKIWHERYKEHGLTIIGVHSPEFEFEKIPANVKAAVERHGLKYPVAQDNDRKTWDAFNNLYWPSKYLIGVDGGIRFQHFGEGEYLQTENEIRAALQKAGWDVTGIPVGGYGEPEVDPKAYAMTRELYGGYDRNYGPFGVYAAQDAYYVAPDQAVFYEDKQPHAHNKWYLQGLWRNEQEAIVHARETKDLEDYIALKIAARSVNVVIEPEYPVPFDVYVEFDGRWLTAEEAGDDIDFDDQGRSVLKVSQPRLYAIVELPQFGVHELKLRSNSDSFAVFAFTFGNYIEGL